MQNIWILNHYANPYSGRHYKFAENLIAKGYSVKIFAASSLHTANKNRITDSRKYLYEEYNNIPFIFIRSCNYIGNGLKRIKNMMDYATGLMSVSKRFDDDKPDVIYASSVHPLTWLAGYKLSKRYGARFIVETRDRWPEVLVAMGKLKKNSVIAKILYKLEEFIYKKADKLIFTIEGGKEYVKDRGLGNKVSQEKIHYINNGVDIEEFNINKRRLAYNDEDLEDVSFKVVYTGSMGRANALKYLLKAAKFIQDKGINDIKFILFGEGYQKKELEEYAEDNNLNNVIFKGRVKKKFIPNILSKSDLNIITAQNISLYKYGLSLNKMFDYFASGKPTISNMVCGYDMLEKYNCGITVKGGSAEALAEGILKFYNMPKSEYDNYCNNALEAAQDFDFKILTDKLEKVIIED